MPPRLTIELPHNVDESTRRYLEHFKWPTTLGPVSGSQLILHHRIPQLGLNPEENSIRALEAFWPSDPTTSHLLVLSPQIELSPLYFHYLKYTMLEYKYSANNTAQRGNLLGISLDLPSTFLNESTSFSPPLIKGTVATPFFWQAPNSHASLYFGERWVELHDFIARILQYQNRLPISTALNEKLVSKSHPSWLEHILKLARARGYWTLYPNFDGPDSLTTLHTELYNPPEEYLGEPKTHVQPFDPEANLTADPAEHRSQVETNLASKSLLTILPFDGDLPKVRDMPLLSWDGEAIDPMEIGQRAVKYSMLFRHEIGGCNILAAEKPRVDLTAGDLFCLDNEAEDDETGTPEQSSGESTLSPER